MEREYSTLIKMVNSYRSFRFIPATFFIFAAATGICPGMIISGLIMGDRKQSEP
jgi:hypothetical protein